MKKTLAKPAIALAGLLELGLGLGIQMALLKPERETVDLAQANGGDQPLRVGAFKLGKGLLPVAVAETRG